MNVINMTENSNEEKPLKATARIHKDLDVRIPPGLRSKLFAEVGFKAGDRISFQSKVANGKLTLILSKVDE